MTHEVVHTHAERRSPLWLAARLFIFPKGIRRASAACRAISVVALLLILAGCEKAEEGMIDPTGYPPLLALARVSPDSVKLSTLPQVNGLLTVTIDLRARITPLSGSSPVNAVYVDLIASSATDPFLRTVLTEDKTDSTAPPGSRSYARRVEFNVPKSATGRYRLQFTATTTDGFVSNQIERSLFLIRNNVPPVISNLQAPDTVTVPVGGGTAIRMFIKATDSDGQSDIKEVFFKSLDSSDPTRKFLLRDDGNADGSSGDAVSGDSVYTIIVQVNDSPTVRRTYRFAFQASDTFGDTTAAIIHRLTVR